MGSRSVYDCDVVNHFKVVYRAARGLDETCGNERNSSRSKVPDPSYHINLLLAQKVSKRPPPLGTQIHFAGRTGHCLAREMSCPTPGRESTDLVQLHKPLAQTINFISVNYAGRLKSALTPLQKKVGRKRGVASACCTQGR